jgi:hypothetical protein
MSLLEAADALQQKFGDEPWFQNVVVTKQKLVVYVGMSAPLGAVPEQWEGYPVQVIKIGGHR